MFALSLVGSLFFNVSVDAARPRILLYLTLAMAPFAVLAPLIGPIIDKLRGGHRLVLLASLGARALVALLLASQLKTLLLYPEAFVIVVAAKVYVVARNTLVPSLVENRDHLVVVNSRLARVGAVSGVVAALIGTAVLQVADASWVLRVGAGFYALAALSALRIPEHRVEIEPSPMVEKTEMHGPGIQLATTGMAGLRMATGFVFFHVGFALKTSGQPAWIIVGVVAAGAVGGFTGTFVAPWLSRRWHEQQVLTASLVLPAVLALFAALRFHSSTAVALAAALGLAGSLGRRAFDGVIQTEAPHARRGQAYAGLETRLEVAWVIGSLAAVLSRLPNWLGLAILSVGLGALSINRIVAGVAAARTGTEPSTLPVRLMETANAVAARGDRQQAVLVALAAAEAAAMVGTVAPERLAELQRRSRDTAVSNDSSAEDAVLRLARNLVAEATY
jgi:MFS family permease